MTSPIFVTNGSGWFFTGHVIKGGQNYTVASLSLGSPRTSPTGETTTGLALFVMLIIMLILGFMLREDLRLLLLIVGSIPFWFMQSGFVPMDSGWGVLLWIICMIFAVVLSL
jgi:hypothetical protein